jgi:hypothetical protein
MGLKSHFASRRIDLQAIAFGLCVMRKKGKMKGRYLPPSRSVSSFVIFIAAVIIFIGLLHIR